MPIDAPNFRHLARVSLTRAKAELAANDPHQLRYAALELRYAIEALTYDRAIAFKNDIPPEEYATWQPRKLMALLLHIDPLIGMTSTIAFGPEKEHGKLPPRGSMKPLGTDHVISLADVKKHYDSIGSYLHMPNLRQVLSGDAPDPSKLRALCEGVAALVEKILISRVWNVNLGVIATLGECMNGECKRPIHKRIPSGKASVEVKCFECEAEYTIMLEQDGGVLWTPRMIDAPCSAASCSQKMALWPHEVRRGTHWRCRSCGTHNGIELSVAMVEDP